MRKITVAGAGHGGIAAAILLSREGYDVTVYESQSRDQMGYDWHDCMSVSSFAQLGIDAPQESELSPFMAVAYYNPARTVKLVPPFHGGGTLRYIDRKFLIRYLIENAEKVGVKFVFAAKITGAVMKGTTVKGIRYQKDGQEQTVLSDLVIDAAGMDSPVRRSLPSELGIKKEITDDETFYVYRAYYEKVAEDPNEPKYTMFFLNDGRIGMDWLLSDEKFVDVLIGSFGPLSMESAQQSVKNFRRDYPFIGKKLLRGGTISKIPLRRTLPLIVANGYAAVGDSAAMTEPLSGSGINLSLSAGRLLAETVRNAGDRSYTVSVLWDYQYKYFKKHGNSQLPSDFIKNMMSHLTFKDLDGLFEGKIFTEKEVASGAGVSYTPSELLDKAKGLIRFPAVLPSLAGFGVSSLKMNGVCSLMPETYDYEKVAAWRKKYEQL